MHWQPRRGTIATVAPASDLLLHDVSIDAGADPRALRATLRMAAGHPILAGHFPGAPLVPGVLLLEAVRQACERALARTWRIAAIEEVRFARPVAPDESVSLRAAVTLAGGDRDVEVDGEWRGAAGRIATFRMRLAPGGD